MSRLTRVFPNKYGNVFGMIHVKALPGTPKACKSIDELIDLSCQEAEMYTSCHIDGLLIENMHDVPYVKPDRLGPETVAYMTRICSEVKRTLPANMPVGIQILAGANKEALAVAQASKLDFIRAEGFVFGHVADEGWIEACAGDLLRYRRQIGAENVLVFADIKKKHCSHAVTADVSISETAKAAEFFLADGVIVTGSSTGNPADVREFENSRAAVDIPVLIGSGVDSSNVEKYIKADGLIVGSSFKKDGRWDHELDIQRVKTFMEKVLKFREMPPM